VVVTDPLSAPAQLAMEEEHMAVEETPQEAPASELPAAGSDEVPSSPLEGNGSSGRNEVPSSPLEGNGSSAGNRSSPPIRELIQGMKFPPPEINPNVAVNPNRALAKALAKAQSLGSLPRVKEPPVPHTSSIREKMGLRGAERVKAPPGPRGSVSRSPAPKTVRFLEPVDETGDSGPRLLPAGAEALVSLSLARPPAPPIPIAATSQVLPASKAESTPAQAEALSQPAAAQAVAPSQPEASTARLVGSGEEVVDPTSLDPLSPENMPESHFWDILDTFGHWLAYSVSNTTYFCTRCGKAEDHLFPCPWQSGQPGYSGWLPNDVIRYSPADPNLRVRPAFVESRPATEAAPPSTQAVCPKTPEKAPSVVQAPAAKPPARPKSGEPRSMTAHVRHPPPRRAARSPASPQPEGNPWEDLMPKSRPPSRGPAGTGLGIRTKSKSPAARPVSAGDSGPVARLASAREERSTAVSPPSSKTRAADSPRGSVSSASEQLAEGWQLAGTKRRPMRCAAYYEMKEQQAQDAEAARSVYNMRPRNPRVPGPYFIPGTRDWVHSDPHVT